MADLRRKCFQVGLIATFGALLIANAKPLPKPEIDIEPQLTAGAAKLPLIDWRTTELKPLEIADPQPEINVVAEPEEAQPEEPATIQEEATEVAGQGEPTEEPMEAAGQEEAAEDFWEVQPDYDELDLLYRTVQAEGYTMGYEGMRLITDAILNLAEAQGVSVTDAILAPGQFTVISSGAIWKEPIYQDTIDAVLEEVRGPRIDYSIKYFRTGHYHGFGNPRFHYGNVYFSS